MADITRIPLDIWIVFILIVLLSLVSAEIAYHLIRRRLDGRVGKRASKAISRFTEYVIVAVGLYIGVFWILQLDLAFFVASLGVVGIGVAFASQQIIQNTMAGLLLSFDRRIQIEDWVEIVGNVTVRPARVRDMTLTKTVLLDAGGRLYYVPNALIITSSVVNFTKAGFVEVPIPFQVPAGQDLERVRQVILDVADKEPKVLPNLPPKERDSFDRTILLPQIRALLNDRPPVEMFQPRIVVTGLSAGNVDVSIRIWIMEVGKRDDIVSDFLEHLLSRLRQEGLLPGPAK